MTDPAPQPPRLDYVATLSVIVAEPLDIGPTAEGHRRIVPITGGTVSGPRLVGRVLPLGADYQTLHTPGLSQLDARYAVETDDGAIVSVDNAAVRAGSPAAMEKLARGEDVDPAEIYFRCALRLRSSAPGWEWVNRTVFVGTGERRPDRVLVHVFAVD